ncbi:mobilization protein [Helicobacter sp. L8]|uniref:mobilization protein n=1 Tax=Helicobacter sp. L8 TaxID=2316078 RepID=UPI001968E431|nr:mobilization protein [Helicobacter sp. L8]
MQNLEQLAQHFRDKYGFQCYYIAIHIDEGYVDDEGKEQINHHAPLEFVTLHPITDKSMYRKEYITRQVARDMQTEVATILGMQRGEYVEKSGRKRIEPRAYGRLMEQARAQAQGQLGNHQERDTRAIQRPLSP